METTLRAVVESMEHTEHDSSRCPKCRLTALLDEAEKVDLVQRVDNLLSGLKCFCYYKGVPPNRNRMKCIRHQIADELAQWLAVNLERIKAEARLEGIEALAIQDGECVWCGWPAPNNRGEYFHEADCPAAICFNLPEGAPLYRIRKTRVGKIGMTLEAQARKVEVRG